MKHKLKRLLRSKRGEMLVETLVSILIFTLSSVLLLSMVSAATSMNRAAKAGDDKRDAQLNYAEAGDAVPGNSGIAFIVIGNDETLTDAYEVNFRQLESDALYSFDIAGVVPSGS